METPANEYRFKWISILAVGLVLLLAGIPKKTQLETKVNCSTKIFIPELESRKFTNLYAQIYNSNNAQNNLELINAGGKESDLFIDFPDQALGEKVTCLVTLTAKETFKTSADKLLKKSSANLIRVRTTSGEIKGKLIQDEYQTNFKKIKNLDPFVIMAKLRSVKPRKIKNGKDKKSPSGQIIYFQAKTPTTKDIENPGRLDFDGDGTVNILDCSPKDAKVWRNEAYPDYDNDLVRDTAGFLKTKCYGEKPSPGYTSKENGPDNCPGFSNPEQVDGDGDGIGDECEIKMPEQQLEASAAVAQPVNVFQNPQTVKPSKSNPNGLRGTSK